MRTARMRSRTAIVVMLVGLFVVAVPAGAQAEGTCYRVRASATTVLDPATGVFSGIASFSLNGVQQRVPASAFATGPATSVHIFEFSQGTVVTHDRLVLVPIDADAGLYSLQSQLEVVEGGRGSIQLLPTSTIDLVAGVANWIARGHLCFDS